MLSRLLIFLTLFTLCCSTSAPPANLPPLMLGTDSAKAADGETQEQASSAADPSCEVGPPKVSAMVGAPGRWELKPADGKVPIVVIYQNHVGHIDITIDPQYRYQWARMMGDGMRAGSRVTQEFYEVSTVNLGGGAATKLGWRNPLRLDRFIVPITQFTGRRLDDGQTFIEVKSDVAGSFLIVVTRIELHP